jgi:phosphoserine phosphatase
MSQTAFQIEQQNWTDEVYEELNQAVERASVHSSEHVERPVAVFDFDNTCIFHDIGELFSHYLIDEIGYRYDLDAFWELVDPRDGRDHIRQLTHSLLEMDPARRRHCDIYDAYLAEMGAIYGRKYVREGAQSCYEWAVRLHVGMTPEEIRRHTVRAMALEVGAEIRCEVRDTRRGEKVRIDHGIRIHEEFRRLMPALEAAGFDVWVVSATNQWTVETFAELVFGVPRERVLGNRVHPGEDGLLSATTCEPVLYRQGKVDIIAQEIGRQPALVFGDSLTDFEMMCEASELAVLIDCGHAELRDKAERRGFAIQPQETLTCSDEWSCP